MNLFCKLLILVMEVILSAHNVKEKECERPNIIFLMDDHHSWDAQGVINKELIILNIQTALYVNDLFAQNRSYKFYFY